RSVQLLLSLPSTLVSATARPNLSSRKINDLCSRRGLPPQSAFQAHQIKLELIGRYAGKDRKYGVPDAGREFLITRLPQRLDHLALGGCHDCRQGRIDLGALPNRTVEECSEELPLIVSGDFDLLTFPKAVHPKRGTDFGPLPVYISPEGEAHKCQHSYRKEL